MRHVFGALHVRDSAFQGISSSSLSQLITLDLQAQQQLVCLKHELEAQTRLVLRSSAAMLQTANFQR